MNFNHYILTRFFYPDSYPHLEERFKIFNSFTKPSIEAQTNTNFTWIISINPKHKSLFTSFKDIKVVFHTGDLSFRSYSFNTLDYLITSRIDNDDALHQDYVANVQELFLQDQTTRVIDGSGYRYRDNKGWLYDRYSSKEPSPFSTLISAPGKKDIVLDEQHLHLPKKYNVQFHNKKLWLQNIHSFNVRMKPGIEQVANIDLTPFNLAL